MSTTYPKEDLIQKYQEVRSLTESLCVPLSIEDYVIQSMPDVSPPKWHLAHTSWFFENFILSTQKNYIAFNPIFSKIFNSYYQQIGKPYPRHQRGLLSRPTVETIYKYRKHVDENLIEFIQNISDDELLKFTDTILLGIHHEQQHQELLLMDIKYNFSMNLELPSYCEFLKSKINVVSKPEFISINGNVAVIGHHDAGFCFDNELPSHQQLLQEFKMRTHLVTNGEYLEFIEAKAYQTPHYWLADGWDFIRQNGWDAPLYWIKDQYRWKIFTLSGIEDLNLNDPVVHVSYYEADAFARWKNARIPTEFEWEYFVKQKPNLAGHFLEDKFYHPRSLPINTSEPQQFLGEVWEWTSSAYAPYPRYKPYNGNISEYNGKFMSNQYVLRGGSCITPRSHIRNSYRNFFQPDKRWQFSGIRLATDI